MPVPFSLDFTAPISVGDEVYTPFPPGTQEYISSPASYDGVKATVLTVRLRLDVGPDNTCLLTDPLSERVIGIKTGSLHPETQYHSRHGLSPFEVEWAAQADSEPKLFTEESQCLASKGRTNQTQVY